MQHTGYIRRWNSNRAIAFVCGFIAAIISTIEPERKKGKWLRTGRDNVFGGFEVECSECGDTIMITHIEDELYCRHCGARMEAGEQDG